MTAAARKETGGSVVGNDQVSVDTSRCVRTWRKRPYKGASMTVTTCEGRLEETRSMGGGLIGHRCVACGAHYTDKRVLIKEG